MMFMLNSIRKLVPYLPKENKRFTYDNMNAGVYSVSVREVYEDSVEIWFEFDANITSSDYRNNREDAIKYLEQRLPGFDKKSICGYEEVNIGHRNPDTYFLIYRIRCVVH